MKELLSKAASAGSVSVKTIMSKPREDMFYFYPGESVWMNPFPGGEYSWVDDGATPVHVPPDVPAKDFWSFTLYDNQTRSMLQIDEEPPLWPPRALVRQDVAAGRAQAGEMTGTRKT